MKDLILQYDSWYIVLCILAGLLYSFVLYYKQKSIQDANPLLIILLALLRFLTVTAISFLLLSPLYKYISEQKSKPVVVLAQDYSESLKNVYSKQDLNDLNKTIHNIKNELKDKYDVQEFSIGDDISPKLRDSFDLKSTNISKYIDYINNSYDENELAAVILSTDGIFNEGTNPDYQNIKFNAPIYAIGLGDTTEKKDLFISNVYYNDIAFLSDQIIIKTDLQAKNCKGNTTFSLFSIDEKGKKKLIQSKHILIDKDDFFISEIFNIKTTNAGVAQYRLEATGFKNEISYKNNKKDIFIEVIDSRVKILVLANSPHPDLGVLKDLLSSNKNYEVTIKFKNDSYLPEKFDLLIYHNLPSTSFDLSKVHQKAKDKNIPEFYIFGTQTSRNNFNKIQNLAKLKGNSYSYNEVQAIVNDKFNSFLLDGFNNKGLDKFPPLSVPFGEFEISPEARVLLYQKINNIDTKYPLLLTNIGEKSKTAILLGSNIYKWRLFEYLQYQNNDILKSLLSQITQYLTIKKDKSQWRVKVSKNIFYDTDPILFEAELYNDNLELVNTPEAYMKIIGNSKEYDFVFSRELNSYKLNAGMLPSGSYRFISTVNYNGKKLIKKGKFKIITKDLEKFDLVARHGVLNKLTSATNGKLYNLNQVNTLIENLNNKDAKPIIYYGQKTKKIIDFKWLFGILLFMLSLEWFVRRYNGTF